MKPTLTLAALIAIGAAFAPVPSMAQTDFQLYIGSAPPAPIYERVPGARHGHVWAPGYWAWRGHRHAWVPGHWIAARPGYVYAPPRWQQRQGGWAMEPARWTRYSPDRDRDGVPDRFERRGYAPVHAGGYRDGREYGREYGHGYRDRDRDGIPDRYERRGHGRAHDTDRDGVPNRYDRDIDGDGVPNRYDGRPGNPYRR
ncbi:YXWGXW repeat-containing protein [Massilia sp. UMI-21]|nr:YXWGXW repeat-containing protein [Massilia sp. UMI-21]